MRPCYEGPIMISRIWIFVLSACLAVGAVCFGQNADSHPAATLVRDQLPAATIVVAEKPTRAASLATHELQPKWDSGASVFSDTTAPDRWRVQIALPLDRLVPDGVQPGQPLYFNVLRATNAQSALAWVPTFAGFHEPSRFGEISLQK
jgi:hypothetical protein